MIDEEDGDMALALAGSGGGGLIAVIVGILFALIICAIAAHNSEECSQKKCAHGTPKLMSHECVCVERPEP